MENNYINKGGIKYMKIRKGKTEDVKEIIKIIKDAIIDMESEGIDQWDNIYPNEDVIR